MTQRIFAPSGFREHKKPRKIKQESRREKLSAQENYLRGQIGVSQAFLEPDIEILYLRFRTFFKKKMRRRTFRRWIDRLIRVMGFGNSQSSVAIAS